MALPKASQEFFSDQKAVKNASFNFLGRVGSSLITFLFIPIFINKLDAESWGIVAFAISLTSIAMIFDFGLGAALNRELARKSSTSSERSERVDVLYSLDLPFMLFSLAVTIIIFSLSDFIARTWLEYYQLTTEDVALCVQLAAITAGIQMMVGFYTGGLQGLQRQFVTNLGRLLYSLMLYGGGTFLLYVFSADVVDFFIWQTFVVATYCITLRLVLYRPLRRTGYPGRLKLQYLRDNYRYSLGIAGTTVLVVCLTQGDKLLLSNLLSLEEFSFYMIAVSVTSLQIVIVQPVQVAIFPQLSALYKNGDEALMGEKFFVWAQRVAVLIFPVGALIVVFSQDLAHFWLQNEDIAKSVSLPMSILAAGSMFNAVSTLPYAVQLSAGWSSLGFYSNMVALILMIPLLILLTGSYGQVGAACVWLLLNLGYVTISIPVMFRRLIQNYCLCWYRDAFVLPCLLSFAVMYCFNALIETGVSSILLKLMIFIAALSTAMLMCWKVQYFVQKVNLFYGK